MMVENSLRTALLIPRLVGWLVLISILGAANTSWAHTMAKVESDLKAGDRNLQLVEQAAPEFTLQDSDGKPVALSDWRGRFWVQIIFVNMLVWRSNKNVLFMTRKQLLISVAISVTNSTTV
ncbi:MAG: hypothetical protein ACI8P9_004150 [Parasphingorhabdus sp.]|jgi:hypothetical protein